VGALCADRPRGRVCTDAPGRRLLVLHLGGVAPAARPQCPAVRDPDPKTEILQIVACRQCRSRRKTGDLAVKTSSRPRAAVSCYHNFSHVVTKTRRWKYIFTKIHYTDRQNAYNHFGGPATCETGRHDVVQVASCDELLCICARSVLI